MKTVAQFSALRRGALDLSVYPLAYAGGEVPEVNIGLMPCLVTSYQQGLDWKKAQIGKELTALLEKRGVKIITWIWQAGGIASRAGAVVNPEDTKGLKIRGGSREMDLMLKAAGGIIVGAVERDLRRDADRLARRRRDLVDQPHQLPPGGDRQERHHRARRQLLVHVRAAADVEADIRQPDARPAEGHRPGRPELEPFALEAAKADDKQLAANLSEGRGQGARHRTPRRSQNGRQSPRRPPGRTSPAATPNCAALLKMAEAVA